MRYTWIAHLILLDVIDGLCTHKESNLTRLSPEFDLYEGSHHLKCFTSTFVRPELQLNHVAYLDGFGSGGVGSFNR